MSNRRAGSGSSGSGTERGRWSSGCKAEVVLRLVRRKDVDSISRELGVTAAMLAQ
jgi:hypothetical protein